MRNCDNSSAHEIGSIAKLLNITLGNKFLSLTSVATKSGVGLEDFSKSDLSPDISLKDLRFAQSDIVVTCSNGEVITLRLDTILRRPYSREFEVRVTKGLAIQNIDSVLLESEINMH